MAHECPECGQECYCDMEDHGQEAPDDCCHECSRIDDDYDPGDDEDYLMEH